ncbi:MAG: response regulator, partial [Gammaproteobacteria bacterium]|nr:response regulator [Gammaproteobacteria bacterium]
MSTARHRALIIDDDIELASMLASYLANADIQLDVSHTARSGLEALAANDYEALLLDVMLPDGDGFDLCRRIRAGST